MKKNEFDFKNTPIKRKKRGEFEETKPLISIIIAYYNGYKYIDEAIFSILNQTFPNFEVIIVNDGSTEEKAIKKLEEIKKLDRRIIVINKENGGAASARNLGIEKMAYTSKYVYIFDDDDLIEPEFLEKAYWSMETNKNAMWAYSSLINFGEENFLYMKEFSSYKEVKENLMNGSCIFRKEAFKDNKYDTTRGIHEDWIMHLNLLSKGCVPIHLADFDFWYRIKNADESMRLKNSSSETQKINKEKREEFSKKILTLPENRGIRFPRDNYNWGLIPDIIKNKIYTKKKNNKIKVLCIFPWVVMGGADKFNIDFINMLDKDKYEFYVATTLPSLNPWKNKLINSVDAFYDLTTFLDKKYWPMFLDSIIKQNNIDICMVSNSTAGYAMIPYLKISNPELVITDYIHATTLQDRNGAFGRDLSAVTNFVDLTCTCNKFENQKLIDRYNINEDSVKTVYIGVDTNIFDPNKLNREKCLEKLDLLDYKDKKIITFISRIAPVKRPLLFADIINNVKRDDIHFVIAGDGLLLEQMKRRIKTNNVTFLGEVKNTELVYKISDITINCSTLEGLALTAYESLAMGVPVIASDVGGQKELIDENVGIMLPLLNNINDYNGITHKQEEIDMYISAIDKVLGNLDQYKENSRKKIINNYSLYNMAKDMDNVFMNLKMNPNKEKINFSKNFNYKLPLAKEIYKDHILLFQNEYKYLIRLREESILGNDKKTLRKKIIEILWSMRLYRLAVKIKQKIFGKNIFKNDEKRLKK